MISTMLPKLCWKLATFYSLRRMVIIILLDSMLPHLAGLRMLLVYFAIVETKTLGSIGLLFHLRLPNLIFQNWLYKFATMHKNVYFIRVFVCFGSKDAPNYISLSVYHYCCTKLITKIRYRLLSPVSFPHLVSFSVLSFEACP